MLTPRSATAMPFPVSVTDWVGPEAALSAMTNAPLRGPAAAGAKRTLMVQCEPPVSAIGVTPQVPPVSAKSPGLTPAMLTFVTTRVPTPVLVSVAVRVTVEPRFTLP